MLALNIILPLSGEMPTVSRSYGGAGAKSATKDVAEDEKSLVKGIFGNTIDYDRIIAIIISGEADSLESIDNNAFAHLGNRLDNNFSGDPYSTDIDLFRGGIGDDVLIGYRGGDALFGEGGNDELRGGNGRDILSGGSGSDKLFGGFGQNTFIGESDGQKDSLYCKSDKYLDNWVYGTSDNQDGSKVDLIGSLDSFDRITVQGVNDALLSYGSTTATFGGESISGIGIFAGGTIEAIYTGGDLTANQLDQMTIGIPFV